MYRLCVSLCFTYFTKILEQVNCHVHCVFRATRTKRDTCNCNIVRSCWKRSTYKPPQQQQQSHSINVASTTFESQPRRTNKKKQDKYNASVANPRALSSAAVVYRWKTAAFRARSSVVRQHSTEPNVDHHSWQSWNNQGAFTTKLTNHFIKLSNCTHLLLYLGAFCSVILDNIAQLIKFIYRSSSIIPARTSNFLTFNNFWIHRIGSIDTAHQPFLVCNYIKSFPEQKRAAHIIGARVSVHAPICGRIFVVFTCSLFHSLLLCKKIH